MKHTPLLFVCVLGIIVLAQGCKDDPTSVGLGLLRSGDFPRIQVDTLSASSYSTVSTQINTFGSDRLLVGKYPGYTAITILRFTSLPAGALDTVTITDARLELHSVYRFGDAAAPLAFLGYKLTANSDSATYDSLTTMAANYYSPSPILAYSPTVVDDTSTVQCSIDTAVVHSWFTTDSSASNNGIILIPSNVGTIKGFASFVNSTTSSWPTLVVDYTKDGISGTLSYNSGVSRFIANIDQSALVSLDPQSMFTQSGVAYRGQLEFNLHSLPKPALILKADLELTANPAPAPSNLNPYLADTLYAYFVNPDSSIASLPVQGQTLTQGTNKVYRFAIANYIRTWANGDTVQKLQFGGLRESSSLDLFPLFGTLSPVGVKPRLVLTTVAQ